MDRQLAIKQGRPYRYSGKCRNLSAEQKQKALKSGCFSLRLKVTPGSLSFYDRIRGDMSASANDIGDFIIRRSDGIPTYNFTCVVDDHLMQISTVVRAEDHLYNTFTQLLLYRALGYEPPAFAHLSLILGTDRKPLSKREAASSIGYFQGKGYLSEALFNYMALLGFSHPEAKEFLKKDELVQSFTLGRVSKATGRVQPRAAGLAQPQAYPRTERGSVAQAVRELFERGWSQYGQVRPQVAGAGGGVN